MSALITRDNKTWEKLDTPILLKELEKRIEKDYGRPCKTFEWCCSACGAWFALNVLKDLYEV